ncbi:MAG: YggS family pyridoxal phosphate-dependent enzyme [Actinomycetota bacterium]
MHATRDEILENLRSVSARIERACDRSGRDPGSVLLVAAAKTQPAEAIGWVVDAGVRAIGENYVRELREMHGVVRGARWHYIGALQTNTSHHVAALADVVETLSGGRATERLARRASESGRTIEALIEVDFTGSRAGVASDETLVVANRVAVMEGLRLRGLMTIPPAGATPDDARPWFRELRGLRDAVRENHPDVVDLSMGMSLDYEAAVEEGATIVRIGTALFGPRKLAGEPSGAP